MANVKQSTTYNRMFLLVLSSDHITGATGKTPTVLISKNAGTFGSPIGTVSEVGNGIYNFQYNTADVGTLGDLAVHVTATGCDPADWVDQVTANILGDSFTLTTAYDFAKGVVAMAESYAVNGAAPTPVQALMAIHQMLMQFNISGTTIAVKKLDNVTSAFSATLDSATAPTTVSRT